MSIERQLARFVADTSLDDVSEGAHRVVQNMLLTVIGTAIAGAREDGVKQATSVYAIPAAADCARVLVYGNRVPAASAATINGLMARALDFCDAMAPGLHVGSSLVPAALATAEMVGGRSGVEFMTALAVGAELASRMNLTERGYSGLDPTGIAGIFGSTAAAARLLRLDAEQTHHALALAFNRCAGSFQSNIDGSLAVRMIQGWVAGDGVTCARLAQAGLTGPVNFISGVYGYARLYARDPAFEQNLTRCLGTNYTVLGTMFKKYPSCGMSQGATDIALSLLRSHDIDVAQIESVEVRVPDYGFKLVGHQFKVGGNPRVNAQFSLQYCIANALLRKAATLDHFTPERVTDPEVLHLCEKVRPIHDPALDSRHHTSVAVAVFMKDGRVHRDQLDIAPGFPGNGLTEQDHAARFASCMAYAGRSAAAERALREQIQNITECANVARLVDLTTRE